MSRKKQEKTRSTKRGKGKTKRRVAVVLESRNPDDVPEIIRKLNESLPQGIDVKVNLDCTEYQRTSSDEQLETGIHDEGEAMLNELAEARVNAAEEGEARREQELEHERIKRNQRAKTFEFVASIFSLRKLGIWVTGKIFGSKDEEDDS